MKSKKIIIGSRGSKLALIYAEIAKNKIFEVKSDFKIENIDIKTIDIDYNSKKDKIPFLKYNDNTSENVILKISNFNNELSKTAIKLNMYKKTKDLHKVVEMLSKETLEHC